MTAHDGTTRDPADPSGGRATGLTAALRAFLWMLAAALSFALMTTLARDLARELHPFVIAFFRVTVTLVMMLTTLLRGGVAVLKTRRHGLYLLRGVVGTIILLSLFTAVAHIPVDEATALTFMAPLFATVGAAAFLRERVQRRRWLAVLVGFAGAMVMLRPGLQEVEPAALAAILAAAAIGINVLVVKVLSRTEETRTILFYMGLYMTPLTLLPTLFVWQTPSLEQFGWLLLVGLFGTSAHYSLIGALRSADVSVVMPLDYFRLPFAALFGFALFGELMDALSWAGAAVIFAATIYITHYEARLERASKRATAPADR